MNPDYLLQDPYPFHISQASIEQAQAEILKEYAHRVEEPERVLACWVHGYRKMMVTLEHY